MLAVGEGTFYDFWCTKREASIIRHEKKFISFHHFKLYLVNTQSQVKKKTTQNLVMKFMKLGSRPDTFYTAEAVRYDSCDRLKTEISFD